MKSGQQAINVDNSIYEDHSKSEMSYKFVTTDGYVPLVKLLIEMTGVAEIFGGMRGFQYNGRTEDVLSLGVTNPFEQINNEGDERIIHYSYSGMFSVIFNQSTSTEFLNEKLVGVNRKITWKIQNILPQIWLLGLIKVSGLRNISFDRHGAILYNSDDVVVLANNTLLIDPEYNSLRSVQERFNLNQYVESRMSMIKRSGIEVKHALSSEIEKFIKPKTSLPITSLSEQLQVEKSLKEEWFSKLTKEKAAKLFYNVA